MKVFGKDVSVEDLVEPVNIDKNIPLKRKNGLVLRDSQIEVLNKYDINYEEYSSLNELISEIEDILNNEGSIEELEVLSEELQEIVYYNYTNK